MEERFEAFMVLISRISRSIRRIKSEEMAEFQLKGPHVSCLYYLSLADGLTAAALCERCDEDKAAVSRSLDYLEKGGYITAIDGTDVKGLTRDNVTSRLRGETGTTVTVTYLNPASEEQEITLTRSRYTIPSVEYQLLADNSGYVKISAFNNNTASQLDYAIHQLTSSGATGLIFDVRNTSGGSLDAAVASISLLCGEGDVVSALYKDGSTKVLGTSNSDEVDLPMTVLVNNGSSYCAELFASSIRDFGKGKIVGVTTAGKGTIQADPYQLDDGSAVVITVAKMLTAKGESFDGVGVAPDVESTLTSEQEQSFYDLTPDIDPQVARCQEVLAQALGNGGTDEEGDASDQDVNTTENTEGTEDAGSDAASSEASSEG